MVAGMRFLRGTFTGCLFGVTALHAENAFQSVQRLLQQGEWTAARQLGEAELKKSPQNPQWQHLVGVLRSAQRDYAAGETLLRQACEKKVAGCWFDLGQNLFFQDRFQDSLVALQRSDDPRKYFYCAQSLDALGQSEEAEKAFLIALQIADRVSSAGVDPHLPLGIFLGREGRLAEAAESLSIHVKRFPQSRRGWFEKGKIEFQLERWGDAESSVQNAARLEADAASQSLLDKIRRARANSQP
jgi:tetratricopeptide (TPR) repeat protein